MYQDKKPVLLITFNRLDVTIKVFDVIKEYQPTHLYLASDGARDIPGEEEVIEEIRTYLTANIDWECEVKTLFRSKNVGCKKAVSEAINWVFDFEKSCIILEDDCLPSPSFFDFCSEMLDKHEVDERVFLVSGYNKQNTWREKEVDYFYSNLGGIWGWATWRRAWKHFDIGINDLPLFIEQDGFSNVFGKKLGNIRRKQIQDCFREGVSAWDYQWGYCRHKNNALAVVPCVSLIKNIGFGDDATHTSYNVHKDVELHDLEFPLKENYFIVPDRLYDEKFMSNGNFKKRLVRKLITQKERLLKR
ncbi:glycosyltransferase [Vibrio coralliirubri]|uniref:glycosyltransferase n=1 Tax=Vibrio coralliirubri TaxID=1516159 RepID=UPI000A3CAF51|nr:glycosyltransferase [Vibrio coralliirubri]